MKDNCIKIEEDEVLLTPLDENKVISYLKERFEENRVKSIYDDMITVLSIVEKHYKGSYQYFTLSYEGKFDSHKKDFIYIVVYIKPSISVDKEFEMYMNVIDEIGKYEEKNLLYSCIPFDIYTVFL